MKYEHYLLFESGPHSFLQVTSSNAGLFIHSFNNRNNHNNNQENEVIKQIIQH